MTDKKCSEALNDIRASSWTYRARSTLWSLLHSKAFVLIEHVDKVVGSSVTATQIRTIEYDDRTLARLKEAARCGVQQICTNLTSGLQLALAVT